MRGTAAGAKPKKSAPASSPPPAAASAARKRKAPVAEDEAPAEDGEPQVEAAADVDAPAENVDDADAPPAAKRPKTAARPAASRTKARTFVQDEEDPDGPLPDNLSAEDAEKEKKRRERVKKTNELRAKIEPAEPRHVDVNRRANSAPAIRLRDLQPELCTLGDQAKKPKADQAMYFFDHRYQGTTGPTVQIEGRLTHKPMLSEFGSVDFAIQIDDPKEQRVLEEWSRRFEQLFKKTAVERKWKFAGDAKIIDKIQYKDFVLRQNAVDQDVRERYPTPETFPPDMIDPKTGERIKTYPHRFKATLMMKKNVVETEVMDENSMQLNPFDFEKGNKVRMAVRMGYGYYKALRQSEFGLPRKLLLLQRLDTEEDVGGGHAQRTRWAADEPSAAHNDDEQVPASGPALGSSSYRQRILQQAGMGAAKPATVATPAAVAPAPAESSSPPPVPAAPAEAKAAGGGASAASATATAAVAADKKPVAPPSSATSTPATSSSSTSSSAAVATPAKKS